MNALPNSATVDVLTSIWQSVLQRSPIGLNDDFFDLGGNHGLARKLFAEIARTCGCSLRPTTICQAPTISALAAVMDGRFPASETPLVPLKPGSGPPVFLTHGIGGSVIDLLPLARRITVNAPIYGLEARGNDGMEPPFERIEDMAAFYLEAVQRMQPQGPYFMVGYSLGGLAMLETAQRLLAGGDQIALLAMLDSYPHASHLAPGQRARLSLRKVKRRAAAVLSSRKHGASSHSAPRTNGAGPPSTNLAAAAAVIRALESAELAWARYTPRPYSGKVNFIRAEKVTHFPEDAAAVWSRLAHKIELETVPGDHVGIITAHVDKLAAVVSRHLADALREPSERPPRLQRHA